MKPFDPPPPAARIVVRHFRAMLPFRSYVALGLCVIGLSWIGLLAARLNPAPFFSPPQTVGYVAVDPAIIGGIVLGILLSRLLRSAELREDLCLLPGGTAEGIIGLRGIATAAGLGVFLLTWLSSPWLYMYPAPWVELRWNPGFWLIPLPLLRMSFWREWLPMPEVLPLAAPDLAAGLLRQVSTICIIGYGWAALSRGTYRAALLTAVVLDMSGVFNEQVSRYLSTSIRRWSDMEWWGGGLDNQWGVATTFYLNSCQMWVLSIRNLLLLWILRLIAEPRLIRMLEEEPGP